MCVWGGGGGGGGVFSFEEIFHDLLFEPFVRGTRVVETDCIECCFHGVLGNKRSRIDIVWIVREFKVLKCFKFTAQLPSSGVYFLQLT